MAKLQALYEKYGSQDCRDLGSRQLESLRDGLKEVQPAEIHSADDGELYILLLRKFREAVAENDKLHGENYPQLLNSLLSVGEDGLYSNSLRFIFELIQNVDDCDFLNPEDCKLDMHFDFNAGQIVLSYNEVGFSPFNVFAITGIAEAAKNVSASKNEIGEKGIGFKSVFGVASRVLIRSGWFSFELYKENFTIPVADYKNREFCSGTEMTLYVSGKAKEIYKQIKDQYCRKEALFGKNPLLFLNKLTSLRLYYDFWRSMEFKVSRSSMPDIDKITRENNVKISVNLRDHDNGSDRETMEEITCTRYTYPVLYSYMACQSRYGTDTKVGSNGGKPMLLQVVVPCPEDVKKVGNGGLYSFLPTQLGFTVPIVCHAPFKLDASREFVDPQDKDTPGGNLWFKETTQYLSELIDYVYPDWAHTVKNEIVHYLPGQSDNLIARNNGKELCLSRLENFKGSRYLKLPLFLTIQGDFQPANAIFYFDPAENVYEPDKVAQFLALSKKLFLVPENITVGKFGITVERNINNRLFRRALQVSNITSEILVYLDSIEYEYSEKQFPENMQLNFSVSQIECFMHYKHLADLILQIANEAIRKKSRPRFSVSECAPESIKDVLYKNFELSETPKIVEQYMNFCKECCFNLDIPENKFLPCYNGIVLSRHNPLSSFAAFCYEMDSLDTFAIRIKLKEASDQLDQCIVSDSGSATDYIRDLRNIRLTVRDSLGTQGYKSYLDLILKSGTDKTRFIQELLQNADDCVYPADRTPTFELRHIGNTLITEYNEAGFTRENIRSITAIGESTKNRLLKGDYRSIGEKGVGFKTVFASASEVKIYSGAYNFSLASDTPTIPKALKDPERQIVGTRMEIRLKNPDSVPIFKPADILELCLCLRKLKKIDINGYKVTISDTNTQRIVSIDKRPYVFNKYTHSFVVNDANALRERENGSRVISPCQQIVCYVPDRAVSTDYALYSGLPTKHRIRIPMAIDAPFELTTSREEIESDCISWNGIVLKELYNAVVKVIHERKSEDRANVLRFARFAHRLIGNQGSTYVNDFSDSQFLNSYDYLTRLRQEKILPTLDSDCFAAAAEKTAYKFPEAAMQLLVAVPAASYGSVKPQCVIDTTVSGVSKEQKERIDAVFNALSCETAPFSAVFPLLEAHAESCIKNEEFRTAIYAFLQDTPMEYQERLAELRIIPVWGTTGETEYISWIEDGIFVKKNAMASTEAYWVLNEVLLPKSSCEKMLGVNINEMNQEWERSRYRDNLRHVIHGTNIQRIYQFLLTEFQSGNLQRNDCLGILLELKDAIPLKNELGKVVDTKMFLCDEPDGYFPTDMIRCLIVHKECANLATYMKYGNLSDIYYEDINYNQLLTADDIETLQDEYFSHSEEILRGFYRDGYLSDELLEEYNLEYLGMGQTDDSYLQYSFPEKPVRDRNSLVKHVMSFIKNPVTIFSEKIERSVLKGKRKNGVEFEIDSKDARNNTLAIYTPEGANKVAFCQMCCKPKPYMLMEVNNLERRPKYYFYQTRVALCLECSRRFEALRDKADIRDGYMKVIRNAPTSTGGTVIIPIGHEVTLKFTATHLAEIQEIFNRMSKL